MTLQRTSGLRCLLTENIFIIMNGATHLHFSCPLICVDFLVSRNGFGFTDALGVQEGLCLFIWQTSLHCRPMHMIVYDFITSLLCKCSPICCITVENAQTALVFSSLINISFFLPWQYCNSVVTEVCLVTRLKTFLTGSSLVWCGRPIRTTSKCSRSQS